MGKTDGTPIHRGTVDIRVKTDFVSTPTTEQLITRHTQRFTHQIAHRLLNAAECGMIGMAFSVTIETLAKCLQLKRIRPDKHRFECTSDVLDAPVIPTVGSLADTHCAIVSTDSDKEPITAMVYLDDFGLYVCDF